MVNNIRVLALDIDGVLTDGTAGVGKSGDEQKRVSLHDLDAVTQAKQAGVTVVLVTGEDTQSVDYIAKRFSIELVRKGAKDKVSALQRISAQLGVPLSEFCFVGDADRDALALREVALGLAPANATPAAKASAHRVLLRSGGAGAVAEAVELLLSSRESTERTAALEREISRIVTDSMHAHSRVLNQSLPVIAQVALAFLRAIRSGHKILLFGNGGSAADAQHVAGELVGRFARESEPWPAIALTTDTSILTAVGNDWAFEDIFARQVRALARPGDVVAGISTSGQSPNVLRGLEAAREKGAFTVGFAGAKGHRMSEVSDVCFLAPAEPTPRVQELHILAWHAICELVEAEMIDHPRSL